MNVLEYFYPLRDTMRQVLAADRDARLQVWLSPTLAERFMWLCILSQWRSKPPTNQNRIFGSPVWFGDLGDCDWLVEKVMT